MQTHIQPRASLGGAIDVPDLDEYDGLSPDELECRDPLADLSDIEREELAQEISEAELKYRRGELRDAERQAAIEREGLRENIILEYGTPENWFHSVGCATDADHVAKLFNLGKTWDEPKNIRRRADGRQATFQKQTKAHQMKGFAPTPSVLTPKVAPAKVAPIEKAQQKAVEKAVERRDARQVVREFYAAAIKAHPNRAKKLGGSLEFNLGQYEPTLARLIGRGKTEVEAVAQWQKNARAAMEAKIA